MGFYSRFVFPRLCNSALKSPLIAVHRQELLASAGGEILEIGFGTGLNLPHYPEHVRKITAVDPNPGMHRMAISMIERTGLEVDRRLLGGEELPFETGAFDCVVSTFTLCSIAQVERALAQVYRVLKPGGQFLLLEHGLSPDPKVSRWQHRLNWFQRIIGDNCRLDRNVNALLSQQPFQSVQLAEFYLKKTPKTHGYMFQGVAIK